KQLFAGPLMNFILAIVILVTLGLVHGFPAEQALIGEVQPDSPAEVAGLKDGDEIVQINGSPVDTWVEFTEIIREHPDQNVDLLVQREDTTESLTVVPRAVTAETEEGEVTIGQV